jgi:hypothetical protein
VLPEFAGRAIRVEMRRSLGPHLAATHIRRRVILLDAEVLRSVGDFERILFHEIFHFAWTRCSNAARLSWERVLELELRSGARGELGWSSERRKAKLTGRDRARRSPRGRRYACESFCDSAAWMFAGLRRHDEFTLPAIWRRRRRACFRRIFPATAPIPI